MNPGGKIGPATRYSMLIVSIACALAPACIPMPDGTDLGPPVFSVNADGAGNEASVSLQEDAPVIEVRSESGIGRATVELESGTPPETVTIRLYLSGLEQFRLHHDETVINASVSSAGSGHVSESLLTPGGGERELSPLSAHWMAVERVGPDGTTDAAPGLSYFEIDLPRGLLNEGSRFFSIEWVDFFR